MPTAYSILRSHLLDYIKRGATDQHAQISMGSIRHFLETKQINPEEDVSNWCTIQQILHEFYIEGLINPGQKVQPNTVSMSGFFQFPFFHLTSYGQRVLENTEYQPYDPDGYLRKIQAEITGIDPVIIRYLEECLACFRRNLLLSAAVMLGCAAEKAIIQLVEVFGVTLQNEDKVVFEKDTSTFIISRKYNALWSRLEPMAKTLPDNLGDHLGNILDRIFDIIRTTRNEAGHPSGNPIEKETVHANLLLFPIFCKRIYKLIEHFDET